MYVPQLTYFSSVFAELKSNISKEVSKATLLWKPLEGLTQEDESVIDGYLELACSPAVLHGGRNKELGVHFLHALGGSIKVSVHSSRQFLKRSKVTRKVHKGHYPWWEEPFCLIG